MMVRLVVNVDLDVPDDLSPAGEALVYEMYSRNLRDRLKMVEMWADECVAPATIRSWIVAELNGGVR